MANYTYISLLLIQSLLITNVLGACDFIDSESNNEHIPIHNTENNCKSYHKGYHFVEFPNSNEGFGYIAEYTYENKETANENSQIRIVESIGTGFYYLKSDNKYASCVNGNCKIIDDKIIKETKGLCNKDNIGKLIGDVENDVSLCLAEYVSNSGSIIYPTLNFNEEKFNNEENNKKFYFIQHKPISSDKYIIPFSIDITANYYSISSYDNKIILDYTKYPSSFKGELCAKASTSEIITRFEDLCNIDSSGKYFICNEGICKSFKQNKSDLQELNEEKCIYKSENKYIGNCDVATVDSKILINNNVIVISPNIEGIIGDFAYNSDGEFTFTKVNNDKKSYYINGDTSTKDDYPLIYCDDIEKCKLMAVDVPGYYLNIPGQASGVLCTSKSKCQVVGSENATSDCNNNIGKVILSTDESTAKFCNDNNGIELKDNTNEYLVTVTGSNFPGVTTTSNTNIAVKLDWTDKTIKIVK